MTTNTTTAQLLRLHDVKRLTGLSRSTIYRFIAVGLFPKQLSLGERSVAWVAAEITQWVQSRLAARDGAAAATG